MTEPLVCCIMLTRDRPQMAQRAVECFRKQTYQNKRLYIYDTGVVPCTDILPDGYPDFNIVYHRGLDEEITIGMLRNRANWWGVRPTATSQPDADILIHFDDDDFSHPNRIEEQIALLQASGKQAVGYRDMLFWRSCPQCHGFDDYCADVMTCETCKRSGGEAWLYSNADPRYCLGTSLCYWRETWERRPFPDLSRGEDKAWLREVDSLGVSSLVEVRPPPCGIPGEALSDYRPIPVMIASVHAGNTSTPDPSTSSNFKRVPEWDSYCREGMSL